MEKSRRNGYIDVIKFLFAVIIAEFHLNTGLFPGGRIAVEGFFMISGYLMMKKVEGDRHPGDSLGVSTVRFLSHKYKGLFPYLLPSVILGYVVFSMMYDRSAAVFWQRLPLLLFDLFPLRDAGFQGDYVVGISWYLSAMFLSLAVLYPLCRKFRSSFTLTVCPLLVFVIYGLLSHFYGDIAVASTYLDGLVINSGLLRGLAGCAAGCVLYEVCERLSRRRPTKPGRAVFTLAEIGGFAYFFYAMKVHPKSQYDYILIFLLFGLLVIGISGLSATSLLLNPKWTKPLGTMSTLIVLTHYCWTAYLRQALGADYATSGKAWVYVAAVLGSCAGVYLCARLIQLAMRKISNLKFFAAE